MQNISSVSSVGDGLFLMQLNMTEVIKDYLNFKVDLTARSASYLVNVKVDFNLPTQK